MVARRSGFRFNQSRSSSTVPSSIIPPRWVRYIHERWGLWVVLNHPVARYGYTLDGVWIPSVDYSDPRLRALCTLFLERHGPRLRRTA